MGGMVATYRRVLRNGPLSRLMVGEFVSSIGDWLYTIAVMILVYEVTGGDAVVLGLMGALMVVPDVILGLPAGYVADRFDRRIVIFLTPIGRALLLFVLAAHALAGADAVPLVAVVLLAGSISVFFEPALGAYVPNLVGDEADLGPANSLFASLDTLALIIGPAIAGVVLVATGELWIAFVLNGLSFLFVAAILLRLPSSRPGADATADEDPDEEDPDADADTDEAPAPRFDWGPIRKPLTAVLAFDVVETFVFGATAVIIILVVEGSEEGAAVLNSAVGIGGLIGALVSSALVLRRRIAPPMLFGACLLAGGVALLGTSGALPVLAIAVGAATFGSLLISVVGGTVVQRMVPDHARGRIISVVELLGVVAYALGGVVISFLLGTVGAQLTLAVAGAIILVAAVIAILALGPFAIQPLPAEPVRARLLELPMFAGLPPAHLEEAVARASVVEAPEGSVIIAQGDVADRFYAIAEGEVEVTRVEEDGSGPRTLRRMGPGEAFGEIGLLTGSPRTATVTARTAVVLAALDKADFLALAGGGGIELPYGPRHHGAGFGPRLREAADGS
ncbi:MAG: MFS transporter [Chloroflexota bacterium]